MTKGMVGLLASLLCLVVGGCDKSAAPTAATPPSVSTPAPVGQPPRSPTASPAVPPPDVRDRDATGVGRTIPQRPSPDGDAGIAAQPRPEAFTTLSAPALGSSVIRVPATMKQGEEAIARLIVSPDDLATLSSAPGLAAARDIRERREGVRLLPRMQATISAPGFAVEPKDVQAQVVKAGEPTEWLWTLVPQTLGDHTLIFTLEGLTTVEGRDAVVRPPALTASVAVSISPLYFLGHYWQWLVTAIVAPLFAFFGKRWLDGRSMRPDERAAPVPPIRHPVDKTPVRRRAVGKMRR